MGNETLLSAAIVSVIVSILTWLGTRRKIESEIHLQERNLERDLTRILYEKRMSAYPDAYSITQDIFSKSFFNRKLHVGFARKMANDLSEWASSQASFILSTISLNAFYEVREALFQGPEDGEYFTTPQKHRVWNAKNKFRSALRRDVKLLFKEDFKDEAK